MERYKFEQTDQHAFVHGKSLLFLVFVDGQQLRRRDFLPLECFDGWPSFGQNVIVVDYSISSKGILLIRSEVLVIPFLTFVLLFLYYVERSVQTVLSF